MSGSVSIISSRTIGRAWRELREYRLSVKAIDGRVVEFLRDCYHCQKAAAILLHNPERGSVILVKQFRLGPYLNGDPPFILEVAAGLVEEETPDQCAVREAKEETGCPVSDVRFIGDAYGMPGPTNEKVSLFIGHYGASPPSTSSGNELEQEYIEVIELSFDEAYSLVRSGEIFDMKTILLLQALKIEELSSQKNRNG